MSTAVMPIFRRVFLAARDRAVGRSTDITAVTHHSVKRSSDFAAASVATVPAVRHTDLDVVTDVTSRTTSLRRDDVTARSRDADADQWRVRTLQPADHGTRLQKNHGISVSRYSP